MTSSVLCNGTDDILKSNHKSPSNAGSLKLSDMPSPSLDSGVIMDSAMNTPVSECEETIERLQRPPLNAGPDTIAPATSLLAWNADAAVKLRTAKTGTLAQAPISIVTAFRKSLTRFGDHPALAYKENGEWHKMTFQQYYDMVCLAAKAFIKLGLEMYHGVGIIGFNSTEWFISDLGCIFAGGLATGIYTTNSPEACHYVAQSASCNVIVVDTDAQLQKILKVRNRLPHLKAVIQYRGELKEKYDNVYTWSQFIDLGRSVADSVLEHRISQLAPNKCCTLIYTSGTTGDPKGVMLSHDNMIWSARNGGTQARLTEANEVFVSYLPLSHVAAQILDIFVPLIHGVTVYFAQPDALKGSLGPTLKEVKPTAFLGVPRVWEKMQETMLSVGRQQWFYKRWIASWAKSVGLYGNLSLMQGGIVPYGWTLASLLVFRTVRVALGFDRCRLCMTAAAPIMKDTLDFFMSLNLPLMEIYGMSESSGPHTLSFPWKYRTVSAGVDIHGCATKIANPDSDGNGEVCMNGRNIFMGYLNMKDKTMETVDEDFWLKSGDLGKIDEDGFLYITGRIKELIITAGGENVSPVLIEDAVKEQLPCVSNCMLVGDRRKFLSILLTLKTEVDKDTSMPLDKLSPLALDWCRSIGSKAQTVTELRNGDDDAVIRAIQSGIDRANENAISHAQRIQKWTILPRDFTINGGELGPTLKLRRAVVAKMYHDTIDSLYAAST